MNFVDLNRHFSPLDIDQNQDQEPTFDCKRPTRPPILKITSLSSSSFLMGMRNGGHNQVGQSY
jgi:hypothetical protein